MTEQEEFEFRHRLEKERAVSTAAPEGDQSFLEKAGKVFDEVKGAYVDPIKEAAGGAVGAVAGGLAGLGTLATGGGIDAAADNLKSVQQATSMPPKTSAGKAVSNVVNTPGEWVHDIATKAGGRIAETGLQTPYGSLPPGALAGAVAGTTIEALPMLLGGKGRLPGAKSAAETAGRAEARGALEHSQDAIKNKIRENMAELDYKIPSGQAEPSFGNKLVSRIIGDARANAEVSPPNQRVTNSVVREQLGIPPEKAVDIADINSVIKDNTGVGSPYEKIAKSKVHFSDVTGEVEGALKEINATHERYAKNATTREYAKMLNPLIRDLERSRSGYGSQQVIDLMRAWRDEASKNLKIDDPANKALGNAQRKAAAAVEEMVAKRLDESGQSELAQSFRSARERAAQAFTAREAWTKGGDFDAKVLHDQLIDAPELGGKMQRVAEAYSQYPKAMRLPRDVTNRAGDPFTPYSALHLPYAVAHGLFKESLSSAKRPTPLPQKGASLAQRAIQQLTGSPGGVPALGGAVLPKQPETVE